MRDFRYLFLFGVIVMFATEAAGAQTPANFKDRWDALETWFHQTLDAQGVVGGSVWFVHDGRALARAHHGFADVDTRTPISDSTIFHWASITKTLTGIGIMQLRDEGRLRLDDPVTRYLPALRAVHNPFGSMDDITLRHLLNHSAGFRAPTWPWGGSEPWHPHEPTSWQQIVAMLPYTAIQFEPGSKHSYSNPGILFLGRVIEEVTGEPYETYIDKNVLRPLSMYDTYFDITPRHLLSRRSNNYVVDNAGVTANGPDFDTGITVSNSGLNAPVPDMVKYVAFLTNNGNEVLARASLGEMWRPTLPVGEAEGSNGTTTEEIGLIFFRRTRQDVTVIGHTGSQKAFISFVFVDPESGAAAIGAFNTVGRDGTGPNTGDISRALQDRLLREIFPLFLRKL